MNDVEEIEDAGLSERHSVESDLNLMVVHLLKLQARPDSTATEHRVTEIVALQGNARQRFTPSMRQRIDIGTPYADAPDQLRAGNRRGKVPRP